jgi:drug/metabolite transporter (DMT)-like permease
VALLALLLALIAAAFNALSSVLQRKANREQPPDRPFGVVLLLDLIHRPVWLFGLLAMIASFLLQAVALGIGTLSAVEPVLVLELPLTIILSASVLKHTLYRSDWLSATAMALGLAAFIAALAPTGGDAANVDLPVEVVATLATLAGIAGVALLAEFGHPGARTALFGVAAGSGFGLTASMIKVSVSHLSDGGAAALFSAWETYAVVVIGVASLVLVQAALHSGTLVAAQPGITLLDPLVSLLWGTIVLGEQTRTGPILVLAAAGALTIGISVLVLSRSPAVG